MEKFDSLRLPRIACLVAKKQYQKLVGGPTVCNVLKTTDHLQLLLNETTRVLHLFICRQEHNKRGSMDSIVFNGAVLGYQWRNNKDIVTNAFRTGSLATAQNSACVTAKLANATFAVKQASSMMYIRARTVYISSKRPCLVVVTAGYFFVFEIVICTAETLV